MVLYYGLLALETANNTIAAANASSSSASSTKTKTPGLESHRTRLSQKQKSLSNSAGKMPLSSSSNSWIYTEDLRKRFEERYADYRYVFVPVYVDRKSNRHSRSTTAIQRPAKVECEHSWMYSRSLRDHLCYSTSKIFLPLRADKSSSTCCVTNHGFMRDELPLKKDLRTRLFKRSSSTKDKSNTTLSLSSLRLSPHTSSSSSVTVPGNTLVRHRTSDVVEEEDDEAIEGENHSVPLIKHDSSMASSLSQSRTTAIPTTDNQPIAPSATSACSETGRASATPSPAKSWMKHATASPSKLTRLRSFFFKSSTASSLSRADQSRQQQRQQQTTLSFSSVPNRIERT